MRMMGGHMEGRENAGGQVGGWAGGQAGRQETCRAPEAREGLWNLLWLKQGPKLAHPHAHPFCP